jgi:hypothetical protein
LLQVRLTQHAIDRYLQRIDTTATTTEARFVLGRLVCLGCVRSTPRHWMRHIQKTPGLLFIYWAELPGVCGLVLDGALITLITRELCRAESHLHALPTLPDGPEPESEMRRLHLAQAPKEAA